MSKEDTLPIGKVDFFPSVADSATALRALIKIESQENTIAQKDKEIHRLNQDNERLRHWFYILDGMPLGDCDIAEDIQDIVSSAIAGEEVSDHD